jgi:cobalt/nickel transport system permease protein
MDSALRHIRHIEDASRSDSLIHRLHPSAKLWTTLVFLIVTASFTGQDPLRALPLLLFPVVMIGLSGLTGRTFLRPLAVSLPFILLIAAAEPILDPTPAVFAGLAFTKGWISFVSIVLRLSLAVSAVVLLAATTPADHLLSLQGIPKVLRTQFLLLHRFSHLLIRSVQSAVRAIGLRSASSGVPFRAWGPFTGRILLRSLDQADRVHAAMRCRGFVGSLPRITDHPANLNDFIHVFLWTAFFLAVRFFDLPVLIERILT